MKIDLTSVFHKNEKVYSFDGGIDGEKILFDDNSIKIVSPIIYKGEIYKVDGSYIINFKLKYEYETECDRCLCNTIKEIETSLSGKLEEYSDLQEDKDEYGEEIFYYEDNLLDLENYLLMQVNASLPMKTLCDENCQGLCPHCGVDLNDVSCNCDEEQVDPRFEKLKELLLKN